MFENGGASAEPHEEGTAVTTDYWDDEAGRDAASGWVPPRWSECTPGGLLADLLVDAGSEEFEALERIGAWERVIAWVQARQCREIARLMHAAQACPPPGFSSGEAADSAVAEVGAVLRVSPRAAGARWVRRCRWPSGCRPRWTRWSAV